MKPRPDMAKFDVHNAKEMASAILHGDRAPLARAITLMESNRPEHRALARAILKELRDASVLSAGEIQGDKPDFKSGAEKAASEMNPRRESIGTKSTAEPQETASTQEVYSYRAGITGVPGVGKSSFIEKFGLYAIEKGHRVAVLAIDPTSALTKGSILGDKTRMNALSQHPNAYIRPTATGGNLGGVARATRESMLLLEAAGYDFILVETVGVGQSEITVAQMVDFFLLLMLPGAGDDLQGIKRGIMEMADLLVVNKADGDRLTMARKARASYAGALHLFPPKPSGWIPRSEVCSALEGTGIEEIYNRVIEFYRHTNASGFLQTHRREQEVDWFNEQFQSEVMYSLLANAQFAQSVEEARESILSEGKSPYEAVADLLKEWSLTPSSRS